MHHPHSVSKTVFQLVSTFSQEDLTFIQALNFSPRVVYPPSEDDEQFSDSSKIKGNKKGNTSTRVEFHEFPPGVSRQQNHLHANLTASFINKEFQKTMPRPPLLSIPRLGRY